MCMECWNVYSWIHSRARAHLHQSIKTDKRIKQNDSPIHSIMRNNTWMRAWIYQFTFISQSIFPLLSCRPYSTDRKWRRKKSRRGEKSIAHAFANVEPELHKRLTCYKGNHPNWKIIYSIDFLVRQAPVSICLYIIRIHTTLAETWFLCAHFSSALFSLSLFRIVFAVRSVPPNCIISIWNETNSLRSFFASFNRFIYTFIWIVMSLSFPLRLVTNFNIYTYLFVRTSV